MNAKEIARQMLDEIYASVPTDTFRFQCLELIHPAFEVPDMPIGRIRVVNYRLEPLTVTLENGDSATFQAGAFEIKFPPKSTDGRRDIQLTLDALSTEGVKQLEKVADHPSRERIKAVVREYAENNLDYPGRIDNRLTVINPTISGTSVQCSLVFNDTINKTIPSVLYTLESHPGLAV
jgi:hypothetical protein